MMEGEVQTDVHTDILPDGDSDEDNDVLDPRIRAELDHLNMSSSEINRMENELDEARSKYRSIVSETSGRMEVIAHDRKKTIQKAREYYKLVGEAKIAQGEALKAARQFQSANGVYRAAKETVALAESRLKEETQCAVAQLTSAWQEMLNHAISKVMEAEQEKSKSEQEHKKRSLRYAELESRIQFLEKKYTKAIKKARPYFELKSELDLKLMQQKQNVNDLLAAIKSSKLKYSESLRKLEVISEEIHESRRSKFWSKIPRMPGVGAETESVSSNLSEMGMGSSSRSFSGSLSQDTESDFDSISGEYTVGSVTFKSGQDQLNTTPRLDMVVETLETCSIHLNDNNKISMHDVTDDDDDDNDDYVFHQERQHLATEHEQNIEMKLNREAKFETDSGSMVSVDDDKITCNSQLHLKCEKSRLVDIVTTVGEDTETQSNCNAIDIERGDVINTFTTNVVKEVEEHNLNIEHTTNDKASSTLVASKAKTNKNNNLNNTEPFYDKSKLEYADVDIKEMDRPELSGEED